MSLYIIGIYLRPVLSRIKTFSSNIHKYVRIFGVHKFNYFLVIQSEDKQSRLRELFSFLLKQMILLNETNFIIIKHTVLLGNSIYILFPDY